MPHKPSRLQNEKVQFVSTSLTVELKSALANWAHDNQGDLVEHIENAVKGGYRISVKEEDEGYSASMTFVRLQGPNKGLVLVERASTPTRALLKLLWCHFKHFGLVWPRDKTTEEDDW